MARMYGYGTAGELVGTPLGVLVPSADPDNVAFLRAFIDSWYRLTDAESHETDRAGNPRTFLNNLIGVVEDGRLVWAWGTQRDVTERRRIEEALRAVRLDAPPPDAPPLTVIADPLRVEQVLRNLLDNAVKFSPAGSAVDVAVAPLPASGVGLTVRDRGPGVQPAHRERIFERFYQAPATESTPTPAPPTLGGARSASGLGLGLWVSRHIAEAHGGTLVAEFPPDGGTRFVLDLPLTPPSAQETG